MSIIKIHNEFKTKIIILIIFVLIVVGLVVYGYFGATSTPKNQAEKRPEIEITPESFDFGEIEYGKIAEYVFKVKNLGQEILEIKRIATSCGCTAAKIEKEIISPNEEVGLFVKYDTGAMSGSHAEGRQERIIYVKSNDPINPQAEVTIEADVIPR